MYTFSRYATSILAALLLLAAPLIAQDEEDAGSDNGSEQEKLIRRNWSLFLENFKNEYFEMAKPYGWKVLELDPSRFKTLHKKMVELYEKQGTASEDPAMKAAAGDTIILLCDDAIKQFPDKKEYWELKKGYYFELMFQDKSEEAIKAYEAGVQGDYKNAEMYYLDRLSDLYSRNPDYKMKAVEVMQVILLRDPNNTAAQQRMKNLISDPEEYIGILRDAYYADSENTAKLYELANGFYEMLQQYDSAAVYFDKLTSLDPAVKNYWSRLGASLMYLGDYGKAEKAYDKLAQLDPESRDAWINLARATLQNGKFSITRDYAEKALKIDPSWGAPHMVIAQAYEETVRRCVESKRGGWEKMKVLDKLVYQAAADEYDAAARDQEFREQAQQRKGALSSVLPTAEDLFVNKIPKGKSYMINADCYGWISRSVVPR